MKKVIGVTNLVFRRIRKAEVKRWQELCDAKDRADCKLVREFIRATNLAESNRAIVALFSRLLNRKVRVSEVSKLLEEKLLP